MHARQFLVEGLELGQRVLYVGEAGDAELGRALAASPGFGDLLGRDGFHVASMGATYRSGAIVDPLDQVAAYAAATQQALDAGFTGLRVAAEATMVVRTPRQRATFARYEHLIDRFMTLQPFAAMCGYDRTELGAAALAEIACMHPVIRDGDSTFQVFATGDGALALAGEIEQFDAALFGDSLEHALAGAAGGDLVVHASALAFIDHHAMVALDRLAGELDATIELVGASAVVAKIVELLGLEGVRVVAAR